MELNVGRFYSHFKKSKALMDKEKYEDAKIIND